MSVFCSFFLQYINNTGFRVCCKELYEAKYDPLSISYMVLSGGFFVGICNLECFLFKNNASELNTHIAVDCGKHTFWKTCYHFNLNLIKKSSCDKIKHFQFSPCLLLVPISRGFI